MNGGIGPADARPDSSVAWWRTRAGPQASRRSSSGMNCARMASAVVQSAASQASSSALQRRGAMQPDPVVRPPRVKSLKWAIAGRSPMPLTTRRRSTRRSSPSRYGSAGGVVADDGVLDGDADAGVDEARDGVQAGVEIRAEAVLGLQVDDEGNAGGAGDFADAGLEALRVAGIAAGQHHRARKGMAANHAGLIDRPAERRSETRDRDPASRKRVEPAKQVLVLVERDVIDEGVAAIEKPADAAVGDVPGQRFRGVEVEAAAAVGLARQRRHGVDAADVLERVGVAGHRWIRAEPPLANARTCSTVAIVVSPGNVVISAPCAHPSLTASSGASPFMRP